jgi:tripartite-type tricarboxylate transporter receptor subunit TctC
MKRQQFMRAAMAAAALMTGIGGAWAQAYPAKPVTVIIPFPPGGTLDTIGRQLAQKLGEQTGQTFVVDNRAGGAGTIGAIAVKNAAPDGYTLLFAPSTMTTTPMTMKSASYSAVKDFAPIALVAKAPLAVAVNKNLPITDIKSLIAHAKANPGKMTFAIGSSGSAGHLSTELLRRAAGVEVTIVPYKGSSPAYQDLVGGQIDAFIDPVLGSQSFAKAGQLRIVGVTSKARLASMPDVPTVAETVPGYEFYSWYALWGPAKLPQEVVAKLNTEVNKALTGDMRDKLAGQGVLVSGGTVADFVKFQQDDMVKSQKIITEGNIRAE